MKKSTVRLRLLKGLLLLHFIVIQFVFYRHYLEKWLLTENTLTFLKRLFQ